MPWERRYFARQLTSLQFPGSCNSVRFLSAIVLLLWATCYGRCLAEQNGLLAAGEPWSCEHQCCEEECPDAPAPEPESPCELCEFIKSGGVVTGERLILNAPIMFCLAVPEVQWLVTSLAPLIGRSMEPSVVGTGPLRLPRMCEWMASTAAPVRGPNAVA